MLGISGGAPSFRDDAGSPDPLAAAALAAFSAGRGSEHAALTALADGRLLVPVVAVLTEQLAAAGSGGTGTARGDDTDQAGRGEKASEMAMPTLIGMDGRRAMPAFTCLESLHGWQPDARPVPVAARNVWRAAVEDSCAVVIDIAGPVPLAVEGARLVALARGDAPPLPRDDPDVMETVAAVLADELAVAAFELGPGDADHDLLIGLTLTADGAGHDAKELAGRVGDAVMARLGGRLRRGVALRFGTSSAGLPGGAPRSAWMPT